MVVLAVVIAPGAVAVLSAPLPNFILSVGGVPLIGSLYVARMVIAVPALYVPLAGLTTAILLSTGAVVSEVILLPPNVLFVAAPLFFAKS